MDSPEIDLDALLVLTPAHRVIPSLHASLDAVDGFLSRVDATLEALATERSRKTRTGSTAGLRRIACSTATATALQAQFSALREAIAVRLLAAEQSEQARLVHAKATRTDGPTTAPPARFVVPQIAPPCGLPDPLRHCN